MYTREDLVADVLTEANNIKKYATTIEISLLDYFDLHPNHVNKCIYGQMTGDCHSPRAAELIEQCTPRYFKHRVIPSFGCRTARMDRIAENVNGESVENFVNERTNTLGHTHFSAIEAYILLEDAKPGNLIHFIKSNAQTIEL